MTNDIQGIYQIKNLITSKVYVGSSKNIYKRWQDHRRNLRLNKHHSPYLQASWNKYGEDCFKFSILEKVADIDKLFGRESEWIVKLKSINVDHGYNIDVPTKNEKRINLHKKETNLKKQLCRPIIQVNIEDGNILNRFKNIKEVIAVLKLSERQVKSYLERNIFKASSDKGRILHPLCNFIIMYEELYREDYDYKSAVKSGELINVWEGDKYKGKLTRYEIIDMVGNITDYTWQRLRTKSHSTGKIEYRQLTLEFLRKGKSLKTVDLSIPIKHPVKRIIVGIKENRVEQTFSDLQDMATKLEITYKMCTRLVSTDNGKKKKRKGFIYVYEKDYLCVSS